MIDLFCLRTTVLQRAMFASTGAMITRTAIDPLVSEGLGRMVRRMAAQSFSRGTRTLWTKVGLPFDHISISHLVRRLQVKEVVKKWNVEASAGHDTKLNTSDARQYTLAGIATAIESKTVHSGAFLREAI